MRIEADSVAGGFSCGFGRRVCGRGATKMTPKTASNTEIMGSDNLQDDSDRKISIDLHFMDYLFQP